MKLFSYRTLLLFSFVMLFSVFIFVNPISAQGCTDPPQITILYTSVNRIPLSTEGTSNVETEMEIYKRKKIYIPGLESPWAYLKSDVKNGNPVTFPIEDSNFKDLKYRFVMKNKMYYASEGNIVAQTTFSVKGSSLKCGDEKSYQIALYPRNCKNVCPKDIESFKFSLDTLKDKIFTVWNKALKCPLCALSYAISIPFSKDCKPVLLKTIEEVKGAVNYLRSVVESDVVSTFCEIEGEVKEVKKERNKFPEFKLKMTVQDERDDFIRLLVMYMLVGMFKDGPKILNDGGDGGHGRPRRDQTNPGDLSVDWESVESVYV